MDLLPKVSSEFSSTTYWENFFSQRKSSFEWYGNYFELCGIISRYAKAKDDILVVGCGNSTLSEQMYDSGCQKITNVDISKVVIKQMKERCKDRENMRWLEMDITNLDMEDNHFSVVIDKGTLDAMMSTDGDVDIVDKMFDEISRVLRTGGRYICISLAQDHIVKKIVYHFAERNWLVRIHKVWTSCGTDDSSTQMPVFAFIFTKFSKLPAKILEVCLEDSVKPTRMESEKEVIHFIKAQQYYAMVRHSLSTSKVGSDLPPIELFSSEQVNIPRYTIHVVDLNDGKPSQLFGIFIVPQGRELEWLFSSHGGRQQIADSAKFKRLAIVSLSRDHAYDKGMQGIQDELSTRVLELSPSNLPPHYKVPFLSLGNNDIGQRFVRERIDSSVTGSFVVEDFIGEDQTWFRQLVFNDHNSLVQSVVRLKKPKSRKKNQKNRDRVKIGEDVILDPDPSHLASEYSQAVAAGFASIVDKLSDVMRVLVIGLGGGSLTFHLLHVFQNCRLVAVELDPLVAEVARKWFGIDSRNFAPGRLKVEVADGLDYVTRHVTESKGSEDEFDAIILDADTKDETLSIQCPPRPFVETHFLKTMAQALSDKGCLFINILSRDKLAKDEVTENLKAVFPTVCRAPCATDVNEVFMCFKSEVTQANPVHAWTSKAKSLEREWSSSRKNSGKLDISDMFKNLVKIT